MAKCPFCGGDDYELLRACKLRGIDVGVDNTVDRRDAARLLHRSPLTLRNWALAGTGPEYIKCNGRYRYSLVAIGKYMDQK